MNIKIGAKVVLILYKNNFSRLFLSKKITENGAEVQKFVKR
jgi:hypothetical protein